MRKIVIGVMGPGEGATAIDLHAAYDLGRRIAEQGWVLLTGGRNIGVMDAACRGAKQADGLTIGILPRQREGVSEAVDIAIFTDMGNARNSINVWSSDVIVACGMGAGTASEVALALKVAKPVVLLNPTAEAIHFFRQLVGQNASQLSIAPDPATVIQRVKTLSLVSN
jgi:hypothetical protein